MGFQLKIFQAFILAFAAFTCLQVSTSHAQYMMQGETKKISGPEYKQSFFDTLSISDFKLYMSSTEAQTIIARDGWQGGWDKAPELPDTIETIGYPYTQGKDTSVALYRYRRSDDGTFRIYAIEFIRRFDQDQSVQILTQKLIEKYGDPTNTEISKKLILLQYSPNRTMRDNDRCDSRSQMHKPQCMAYVAWAKGPKFTIKITSRAIEMTLEDQTEALNHQSNILARKNLGKEILKRETTKELNLDF
ncbi:MAG: hypothetical protein AUJ12_00745 [Alphaproteobacteria bacterium CG1_02_46_17]|nr:MAG: hypothetical protein AUJ12_00745 [Alphaproteobacteria bacterium CG1_02_46_17]